MENRFLIVTEPLLIFFLVLTLSYSCRLFRCVLFIISHQKQYNHRSTSIEGLLVALHAEPNKPLHFDIFKHFTKHSSSKIVSENLDYEKGLNDASSRWFFRICCPRPFFSFLIEVEIDRKILILQSIREASYRAMYG